MKVLFIYPPAHNIIRTNLPTVVEEEKGYYPPLGLMYVAANLERETDFEIEVLDTQVKGLDYEAIREYLNKSRPDVVGIQTMTFTYIDAIMTARLVKDVLPKSHVCLGGPHVNIYPEESLSIDAVDSLVLGEGEYTFTRLVKRLHAGESVADLEGVASKENGKVVINPCRGFIEDLDALAHPARHLTDYQDYYSLLAQRQPVTTMMTSRGCPYRCIFCDRPHLGSRFRSRGAHSVVSEMEECLKLGIHEFFLYDDTFTINRKRVMEITNEVIEKKLDVAWDIRARLNTVDEEVLSNLKKAGCKRIHYGVEAGTPEILKVLRKGITLEQAERVFRMTHKMGFTTLGYFMIGAPGETREQMMATINFAKKLKTDFVHFSVLTPFPATELYALGLEKGVLKSDYWRAFAKNPTADFTPALWEENLDAEELMNLLKLAYKSFYVRPFYIVRELLKIKSFGELTRKVKAGLRVMRF